MFVNENLLNPQNGEGVLRSAYALCSAYQGYYSLEFLNEVFILMLFLSLLYISVKFSLVLLVLV